MNLKINANLWISTFFLYVFCFPRNADALGNIILVQNMLEVIGFCWTIYIIFSNKVKKLKKLSPMLLIFLWMYPCTLINFGNILKLFETSLRLGCIVILSEYLIERDLKKFIFNASAYWTALMLIELFSAVTNCFGTVNVANNMGRAEALYLFGMKVEIDQYMVYALFFTSLAAYIGRYKHKIQLLLTTLSILLFSIITLASTAFMGMFFFFLLAFCGHFIKNKKQWKYVVIFTAIVSCAYGFIGNTSMFEWLVNGILHEGLTLNGRTVIWAETLKLMSGWKWLWGYGFTPDYIIRLNDYFYVDHPHNQYLQSLFCYGIPGLCLYIWLLYEQIKKIRVIENRKLRKIYIATIIANLIISIVSRNLLYGTAQIFFVMSVHITEMHIAKFNRRICRANRTECINIGHI